VVAASLTIHLEIDDSTGEVPVLWTVPLIKRADGWKMNLTALLHESRDH
jgi:hypothetical protein